MLTSGTIKKNPESQFLIGPDESGKFIRVSIKSIHRKRSPVDTVYAGQSCSFALKKIKRNEVRKGMVIVSTQPTPTAYWQFKADVHILHHPTTIGPKYQAVGEIFGISLF
uniref:GTP-binding protein 1 (Trinotate prediction) n=1 Tax=Myxobolus squamalis TaxID=59785 RepID=A0A6B2G7T0_MYXSQ